MSLKIARTMAFAATVAFLAAPAGAETFDFPIHVKVSKNEINASDMQSRLAQKVQRAVCKTYGDKLDTGDMVRVTVYGTENTVVTSFNYTKSDCEPASDRT